MSKEKETKERKRVVVEEVEAPVTSEVISSTELQKEEPKEAPKPDILKEAAKTEAPPPPTKSSSVIWWILIPGIFLLGALLGGIVFYQKGVNKGVTQTPTPIALGQPSTEPTSTPSAEVDLTKYSLIVQNGAGVAGAAGEAKSLLVKAGFKVSSTGNAASYDFTKTIIKAKTGTDAAFLASLTETLAKTYVLDKNQTLPNSSKDGVIIIIGSSKK